MVGLDDLECPFQPRPFHGSKLGQLSGGAARSAGGPVSMPDALRPGRGGLPGSRWPLPPRPGLCRGGWGFWLVRLFDFKR